MFVMAASAAAYGQESDLISVQSGWGLSHVVKASGADLGWIWSVMLDNKLTVEDISRLKPMQNISVLRRYIGAAPPPEIALASKLLLKESLDRSQVEFLQSKQKITETRVREAEARVGTLIAQHTAQLDTKNATIAQLKSELEKVRKQSTPASSGGLLTQFLALVILAGGGAFLCYYLQNQKVMQVAQEKKELTRQNNELREDLVQERSKSGEAWDRLGEAERAQQLLKQERETLAAENLCLRKENHALVGEGFTDRLAVEVVDPRNHEEKLRFELVSVQRLDDDSYEIHHKCPLCENPRIQRKNIGRHLQNCPEIKSATVSSFRGGAEARAS